tara:strand:+ start:358 stop:609 length:252 start_codon:yes stop_codon:yes gene_type:complete
MRGGSVVLSSGLLQEEIRGRWHDAITVQYRRWRASVEFIEFLRIAIRREVLRSCRQVLHKLSRVSAEVTKLLLLDKAGELAEW